MKPIEQLDSHIQSYRNEQKRKERERIRKIFQYLAQKREQLALGKHPVSRIHYNIKIYNPVLISPFTIKKVSFNSKVKPTIIQPIKKMGYNAVKIQNCDVTPPKTGMPHIPNFCMSEYEFENADITSPEMPAVNVIKHNVSYSHPDCPLIMDTFQGVSIYKNTLNRFFFPQQPLMELGIHQHAIPHQFSISTPVLPDSSVAITPLQAFHLPHTKINYELNWSDVSALIPPLRIAHINQSYIEYKSNIPDVKMTMLSKLSPKMLCFKLDIQQQLLGKNVDLQRTNAVIPEFAFEMGRLSIPHCEQTFTIPAFDFSSTIEKLKKALKSDQTQGE